MQTKVYWIEDRIAGRLGIMGRPRSGDWLEDDIGGLRAAGVDVLVSLLTEAEESELDLLPEADACMVNRIEFLSFPIVDHDVPTLTPETAAFIQTLVNRRRAGKSVVIHCRMGTGRSAVVAACALIAAGIPVDDVFARIERARGSHIPDTLEQDIWIRQFAELYGQPVGPAERFISFDEREQLWNVRQPKDYLEARAEQDFNGDLPHQHYIATLEPALARRLWSEARKRQVDIATLVNLWLNEKLQETTRS